MSKDKREEFTEEQLACKFRDDFDALVERCPVLKRISYKCRNERKERYETILLMLETFHEFYKMCEAKGIRL